ncbi:hypothetical protein [Natronococcus sp. A-GB7]|uniref:hypothetical protein n=1 Tax=Natronococcus sp. A-GB7 TaxID=3037649 RepID=UPI00241E3065|nr:hypothetical protein [Natronococcus sp. A-GB7]MDG5820427.1 hypothetical protein [Natronococcus sp. A-GB7]
MSPSRRTVLLGCAVGLAGAGSLGYRHRRRLRGRSDLEPIERALDTEPPAVDPGPPVSLEHLEARFARVEDAVDEAEAVRGESLETHRTDYRELPPSALENVTHAERRSALETYRYMLGVAYHTTASERYERESGGDPGALEDRLEDERERLASLEYEYRGDSLTETVVGTAAIDERHADATRRVESPEPPFYGRTAYPRAWRFVGYAEASRVDAERFLANRDDGTEYEPELETTHERLREATDELLAAVSWERDGTPTRASDVDAIREMSRSTTRTLEDGYPALAVRRASRRHTHARSLDALEEVPGREDRDETGWTVDAGAVVDRKEAAIDAISRVLEEHGDDSLGVRLLATASRIVEEGDDELETLRADVHELSDDEWNAAVEPAWLYYREAAVFADAIPETLALVAK